MLFARNACRQMYGCCRSCRLEHSEGRQRFIDGAFKARHLGVLDRDLGLVRNVDELIFRLQPQSRKNALDQLGGAGRLSWRQLGQTCEP